MTSHLTDPEGFVIELTQQCLKTSQKRRKQGNENEPLGCGAEIGLMTARPPTTLPLK